MDDWLQNCEGIGGDEGPEAVGDALDPKRIVQMAQKDIKLCIFGVRDSMSRMSKNR